MNVGVCGDDGVDVVFAQLDGRSLPFRCRGSDGEKFHDGCDKTVKAFWSVQGTLMKSLD